MSFISLTGKFVQVGYNHIYSFKELIWPSTYDAYYNKFGSSNGQTSATTN